MGSEMCIRVSSEGDPRPASQLEPSLSPQWDEMLHRALARDPARRYQSAEEFLDAIAELEQPAVADLPLPRLRTLGIGIAIFAGLILAVAASPTLTRFRRVTPVTALWQRPHIAPPAFAMAKAPSSVGAAAVAKPRVVKPLTRRVAHAKSPAGAPVQETNEQAAPAAVAEGPQDPTPAKRGFWSRLNVFRKRSDRLAAEERR